MVKTLLILILLSMLKVGLFDACVYFQKLNELGKIYINMSYTGILIEMMLLHIWFTKSIDFSKITLDRNLGKDFYRVLRKYTSTTTGHLMIEVTCTKIAWYT